MGESQPLLDPNAYTVVPRVAVLDETTLPVPKKGGEDGEYEYFTIDSAFLEKVAFNGNRREAETGDMCPLVIGRHTKKGAAETAQPEIVGYARNWTTGRLGNTTRSAAFADFWIKNEEVERVKKFPRRSAEIWRGRAEIDPIALLGATTPERDLGLLPIALSRHPDQEISATFYCDRGFDMPTDVKTGPEAGDDTKQAATPSLSDLVQTINKLAASLGDMNAKLDKLVSGGVGGDGQEQPGAGPDAGAPADGAAGEPGSEMSDEEIEQLIQELEGGQGGAGAPPAAAGAPGGEPAAPRKEDTPVQTMGYPGGQSTVGMPKEQPVKQSRDPEVDQLRAELEAIKLERARDEVTAKLNAMVADGVYIEDVAAEVRDVLALPADMRPVQLSRIEKNYKRVNRNPLGAVVNANGNTMTVGEISDSDRDEVIRLARDEGYSYEVAFKKKFGRFPWEPGKAKI